MSLTLKIITMTNLKTKTITIKILKSVVEIITMMLTARYISFTLSKLIFRNRNDEL